MPVDFDSIADYYDAMYVDPEEYETETEKVRDLVKKYGTSGSDALMDIACGTGEQSLYLSRYFQVTGLDFSGEMLNVARKKVPAATFVQGDMFDFRMDGRFGAAVNLYGSIGFAKDYPQMLQGLQCAFNCLKQGGVFILTPWGTKETFREGLIATSRNGDDISYCRMESVRRLDENRVRVEMVHLVGRNGEIAEHRNEQTVSLWSEDEYVSALESSGFSIRERLGEREFRMGAFVCTK